MNPPQTAPLEEVAEHVTVAYVGPTSEFFRDTGIPYLRTGNVGVGRLLLDDLRYVTEAFHRKNQKSALKAGDVLVTRVISDEINCGIVPAELGEANCGNVIAIRPGDRLVPNYLIHLIRSPEVQRLLIQRRVGSAQSVVNTSVLKSWKVPLLSVGVQRRIAEVLDRAEALRAKRRAALAQLDTLTQSIFLDLFGDPGTNPKEWPVGQIGDLLESASYGTSEKSGSAGQFPVLRMNNITRTGEMDLADLKFMDLPAAQHERYLVRVGDVLFNRTNSAELVGKTAIVLDPNPMAFAGYLVRLRVDDRNDPEYLAAFLNTAYAKKMLRGMCRSIIGMANINATEIQKMRIPKPPLDRQRVFARCLGAVRVLRASHRASLAKLDALFASLQHRAFRGEL